MNVFLYAISTYLCTFNPTEGFFEAIRDTDKDIYRYKQLRLLLAVDSLSNLRLRGPVNLSEDSTCRGTSGGVTVL